MELFRGGNRWRLFFTVLFFVSVTGTTSYLYALTPHGLKTATTESVALLSSGILLIFTTLWAAVQWRKGTAANPKAGEGTPAFTSAEGASETRVPPLADASISDYTSQQNRKIAESIKYAKRIQSAILPNSRQINRVLPDSFILYKPRDVVSGDFPWFAQVKNETFMAAVDCTGHGVPGALLSLVGYFLLNDIVRSQKVTDTGRILDLLDEAVSTTLRPDEDAGTKDGMDISLCRINAEKRKVEYAGAHRPLYVMRDGVLEVIKGNKFPIGGGIFKNQTNFSSTAIQLDTGDSIYFCSDGFCDQFGGKEGRKFGTRQLRELISKVHAMPMAEAVRVFDDAWESWKGTHKQTDDVLLIGIKFN